MEGANKDYLLWVFLSEAGTDQNPGTKESPKRTISAALDALRYTPGSRIIIRRPGRSTD